MRKIFSLFFVLMLVFQTLSLPVYALSSSEEIKYKQGIVSTDNKDANEVPLYKDFLDPNSLLGILYDGDQVDILDSFDDFSYIAFFEEESNETLEGFIENKYLNIFINENNPNKVDEDEDPIDTLESDDSNDNDSSKVND